MEIGELDLRITWEGAYVRIGEQPGTALAPARWTAERAMPLHDGLDAFATHRGPVRVSVRLDDEEQTLRPFIGEALHRRPDALLVYLPEHTRAPVPLSLPLRIANRSGRPTLFDWFAALVAGKGLLREETETPDSPAYTRIESPAPHVVHAPIYEPPDPVIWTPVEVPRLIVLEGIVSRVDPFALIAMMRDLGGGGAPAVLAVKSANETTLETAVAQLYRKLAHDRDLDRIARELLRDGHDVLLLLAEDAERCLLRRAVLEHPREGLSITRVLQQPDRAPRSELEAVLSRAADGARHELARIANDIAALEFDEEAHAATALAAAADDLNAVLAHSSAAATWWRATRAEPVGDVRSPDGLRGDPLDAPRGAVAPAVMPARNLHALLHRDGEPLRGGVQAGEPVRLDVSIRFVAERPELRLPGFEAPIPVEALRSAFGDRESLDIDVVVWAQPDAIKVACDNARVSLPRLGESGLARFELTMLHPGTGGIVLQRARIAAYHRNRLLQSMTLDIAVAESADEAATAPAPVMALDYAASEELVAVDETPSPRLSIFVNDGADGTHWIGARTSSDQNGHGVPIALRERVTEQVATSIHDALRNASALGDEDRYATPLAEIDQADRTAREQRLVALAQDGYHKLYTLLFGAGAKRVRSAIAAPNADIEIARLRGDAPALPWQLVYDLPISRDAGPALCPSYLAQLGKPGDLLDHPERCARQPMCPHRETLGDGNAPADGAPTPSSTVCPFGFWGVRHRIAQPLAVKTKAQAMPAPRPGGQLGVTIGYFEFDGANEHIQRLPPADPERKTSTNQAKLLTSYLGSRRDAVIYFFCHGRGVEHEFLLQVGRDDDDPRQYLAAGDLVTLGEWPHAPIVILNGCKTLQVQPDKLNVLLDVLRELNAAAIIGPEIEMFTTSAAAVGERLVSGIFERIPLDELMMRIRRDLLREMSPMGLAYNVYAPSGLVWTPPTPPERAA